MRFRTGRETGAVIAATAFLVPQARAEEQISIGTVEGANEGISLLTAFIQSWVNFATGPWAVAVIAISLVVGIVVWMLMPREGWLGWVARGLIGGIILMNLAAWMQDLGFSGGA